MREVLRVIFSRDTGIHPRTFISRLLIYLYSDIFLHSLSLDIFETCVLFASDKKSYGYLDIFLFSE